MSPVFTFSEPLISNESCKSLNKIYFNKIKNKLPNLIQLFEDKNIIVNNNQATKKLTITIKEYNCTNNIIYLQASLFEDRNLIYQNLFVLDSYSNSNSFKTFYKDEKMDINKFFKVLIEDLENSMKFLIYDRELVFFAPLYDVACTGFYDTSKGYDSHLTINGKQSNIRPNDFKPLCERLKIDFKAFKKEAHIIAKLYETELPSYIEEIKSLGSIPFYRKIQKTKIGEGTYLKVSKEPIEFHEVLSKFHKMRVEHLKEYGWII
ncbi:HipA domain-containing protein [Aliarcobacter cryaerophilus]|nr:hypothetical protein RJG54_12145 [Arcobacter sp. AZ-2023]